MQKRGATGSGTGHSFCSHGQLCTCHPERGTRTHCRPHPTTLRSAHGWLCRASALQCWRDWSHPKTTRSRLSARPYGVCHRSRCLLRQRPQPRWMSFSCTVPATLAPVGMPRMTTSPARRLRSCRLLRSFPLSTACAESTHRFTAWLRMAPSSARAARTRGARSTSPTPTYNPPSSITYASKTRAAPSYSPRTAR